VGRPYALAARMVNLFWFQLNLFTGSDVHWFRTHDPVLRDVYVFRLSPIGCAHQFVTIGRPTLRSSDPDCTSLSLRVRVVEDC
jgi:hypothetical protein